MINEKASVCFLLDNGIYHINPKVKALEMGDQCTDDLSIDYKKELAETLEEKYLHK